jgi:hypothetical protein
VLSRSRQRHDVPFAEQVHGVLNDLLCQAEGTPTFLLMADEYPECEQFLRGRPVPEANPSFYSRQWRLLLVKTLAQLTTRENS